KHRSLQSADRKILRDGRQPRQFHRQPRADGCRLRAVRQPRGARGTALLSLSRTLGNEGAITRHLRIATMARASNALPVLADNAVKGGHHQGKSLTSL